VGTNPSETALDELVRGFMPCVRATLAVLVEETVMKLRGATDAADGRAPPRTPRVLVWMTSDLMNETARHFYRAFAELPNVVLATPSCGASTVCRFAAEKGTVSMPVSGSGRRRWGTAL
jgi:hypothetical protein